MTPGERALREDVAVVSGASRAIYSVTGERPLAYLQDVLAQDLAELRPRHGAVAAVLTANGRVAAEVRVLPLDDRVLVDAEPTAGAGIREHVVRLAALAGVEVEDISDRFSLVAVRGPNADSALTEAGLPVPPPDEAAFDRAGDVLVVRVAWGVPGVDLIGPAGAMPSLSAQHATVEELDAARIEAGRPRFGVDVTEELLVNETPLLARGVSMSKGCYPGQESVARIHNLGRIRRSLRSLRSDGGSLAAGVDVEHDGTVVGRVTSATRAPDGTAVGIALLASEVEPGARVRIDGIEALVGLLS